MSKPNEARAAAPAALLFAVVLVAAALPSTSRAAAELTGTTSARNAPATNTATSPAAAPNPTAAYHLRCWQEGKLIIDEPALALRPETTPDAELLRLRDPLQQPVLLVARAGTTCLARPQRGRGE